MSAVLMLREGRVCGCRAKGSLSRGLGPGLGPEGLDYTQTSRKTEKGVLLWVRIAVEKPFHLICVSGEPH